MKSLSAEAPPRGKMAIAITAAMLLQSYSCFADDETAGSGHLSMTNEQVLHWLSQPENHGNAKVTEQFRDDEKTRVVIEITDTDKNATGATSSLNRTMPSANAAVLLAELPPAQNDDELMALAATAPASDLATAQEPAAQPLGDQQLSANDPGLSNDAGLAAQPAMVPASDLTTARGPAAQPLGDQQQSANDPGLGNDAGLTTLATVVPASDLTTAQGPAAQPLGDGKLPASDPGLDDDTELMALAAMTPASDSTTAQGSPAQPLDDDKLSAGDSGSDNYTSIVVNNDKPELAQVVSPHAVHNAHLAMQTAGDALDERMSTQRTGIDRGHGFSNRGAWIQYSYNKATQDVRDNVPGYHAKTNGFTIGADSVLENNRDIRTGIAYTYARGDVKGEGTNSTIDTDSNIFSLYTSSWEDNYFFDGRLSYAFGKNSGQRTVAGKRCDASYRSRSWGVGLSGGYHMELKNSWYWQPKVAFNYYSIDTDDYSESARDPNQSFPSFDQVNNGRYSILELGAGVSLLADLAAKDTTIRPELGVMAFHDFKKDPVEVTAHYATGGESFLINGAERVRNRYQAEAALNVNVLDHTVCTLSYGYHWASHFKANGFIARISYEF